MDQNSSSKSTRRLAAGERVVGERIVEHCVRIPKRVVREDVIEKVYVVPEKVISEELVEDVQTIRERLVEVARPVYQERFVDVPQYEYIEKLVEVPERVIQERVREVPRVEVHERLVEVPKLVTQERMVEIPQIEYREVPVERVVEVPEVCEQVVVKEVPVPQYVERPVAEHVTVEVPQRVERLLPIAVEVVTCVEYRVPRLRRRVRRVPLPLYIPRFYEVPMPEDSVDASMRGQTAGLRARMGALSACGAPSLAEVERLASDVRQLRLGEYFRGRDARESTGRTFEGPPRGAVREQGRLMA